MDQLSAHLDRGWDLIQKGDPTGAELSARRALDLDEESPEAHNLLGYVAALHGDFERALEHYREALDLDDTYLEAILNAAEVLVYPLGGFDEAIALCDQALDLSEGDDELVDVLLLQFDALLGKNDIEAARALCARFPEGPFENPTHRFLLGRAYFEVGDLESATPIIEDAAKAGVDNPEVYYYLGMIRDERGDATGATTAFLRVRHLDALGPPVPWTLSRDTFEHMVDRAAKSLGDKARARLGECDLYISDLPGVEVIVDAVDPRAAVLIEPALPGEPTDAPPGRVFVYQSNIERIAGSLERVEAEIRHSLERELARDADAEAPGARISSPPLRRGPQNAAPSRTSEGSEPPPGESEPPSGGSEPPSSDS